jgi:hypothetical protein
MTARKILRIMLVSFDVLPLRQWHAEDSSLV